MSPSERVAKLYRRALGSLFVAFYDSQGYGGGIQPAFTRDFYDLQRIEFTSRCLLLVGSTLYSSPPHQLAARVKMRDPPHTHTHIYFRAPYVFIVVGTL
jgi:hypothetical protein